MRATMTGLRKICCSVVSIRVSVCGLPGLAQQGRRNFHAERSVAAGRHGWVSTRRRPALQLGAVSAHPFKATVQEQGMVLYSNCQAWQ